MKFRVYFFDPELNEYSNLVYTAESEQDALNQFWEETELCHRSIERIA